MAYEQIDWVVRHFRDQGKRVLLVLHHRHTFPNKMPEKAKPILQVHS